MPRPQKKRRIGCYPDFWSFAPDIDAPTDTVTLTLDEFETVRLIDYLGFTQEDCAGEMNVARSTVTSIYDNARKIIARALVEGKRVVISGGKYALENKLLQDIEAKGSNIMRIAVTYENGQIFQHFGRTEQFKLYDVENGRVVNEQVIGTNGSGHGALAGFLKNVGADVLICGGIGGGAQMAVSEAGITLFGGNIGSADDAVKAYLSHELEQNENPSCDHHEHSEGHSCGGHSCH